jgi:hypothetical protein
MLVKIGKGLHKRVRAEQRLAVAVQDAGREAVVCGFDVAVCTEKSRRR